MRGMCRKDIFVNNVKLNVWIGGKGAPILLLHGYPQTGQMWRKIVPDLLKEFTVVCPDLRGYGDSEKPRDGYDKRNMAKDIAELMRHLGHDLYAVGGHDRGGRVAHRLALDYPDSISCVVFMDIVPTHAVFQHTNKTLAATYWHWFFFQALDLPETMISNNPEVFLRYVLRSWSTKSDFLDEEVFHEYLRAFKLPGTIRATLEDYRAAASIDLEHDEADLQKKIKCPVLTLWSNTNKTMEIFDVVKIWQERAVNVKGQSLDSGHFIPEESPEILLNVMVPFIRDVIT